MVDETRDGRDTSDAADRQRLPRRGFLGAAAIAGVAFGAGGMVQAQEEPEETEEEEESDEEEEESDEEEEESDEEEEESDEEEEAEEFSADLSGEAEVPSVETDASGESELELDNDESRLEYELEVEGPFNGCVTAAHVHQGAADENGPVVAFLFEADEPLADPEGTIAEDTLTADDLVGPMEGEDLEVLLEEMRAGDTYVNVHSTEHPPGEVRGQLEPED